MASRKTHRKSRYGCEECKRRHVKCDETRPQCDKCRLSLRACSYLGMRSSALSRKNPSSSTSSLDEGRHHEFTLLDLSLVHHFTTSTCRTLSTQRSLQKVWGMEIVQIAFTHTFLLHGILSIAALHRAFTEGADTESLINYAVEHKSIALNAFQHALIQPQRDQADALFALSIITFIYTMAIARETPDGVGLAARDCFQSNIIDFGWIRMARGIKMVLIAHMDWIKQGCLKELLQERKKIPELGETEQSISPPWWNATKLAGLWRQSSDQIELQDGEAEVYEETFSYLEYSHRLVRIQMERTQTSKDKTSAQPTFTVIFRWLLDIPEAFIEYVEQHRPIALILLAHYSSISARLRHMWWSEQSSQVIIKRVQDLLDAQWHVWLEYPLQHIR